MYVWKKNSNLIDFIRFMQQFLQDLNSVLELIDSYIGGSTWFVLLLLGTGVFFTFYLGFPQMRYFGHALKIVRGKYDKEGDQGDTSHFQALATALSGTVGTGNIAGVALAIHLGGAAALFWMILTAFLGMTTKFVEVTLSHKYREVTEDGTMAGGPMYYMKNRLNWKIVATIFAIATVVSSFGTGSLPQINSIANSMFATFGFTHYITGHFGFDYHWWYPTHCPSKRKISAFYGNYLFYWLYFRYCL